MSNFRAAIPDFQLANPIYSGAQVSFFTVDEDGTSTGDLATLYADPTGTQTVANPQTLDSEGKFSSPVYTSVPVIAEVVGPNVASHATGAINARGTWREDWVAGTIYYSTDFVQDPDTRNVLITTDNYTAGASVAADITAGHLSVVLDQVVLTGVQLSGNIWGPFTNVATAATTNIGVSDTAFVNLTGAVGVTSLGSSVDRFRAVKTASAVTFTSGVSLIGPQNGDFTSYAGQMFLAVSDDAGIYRLFATGTVNSQFPQVANTIPKFVNTAGTLLGASPLIANSATHVTLGGATGAAVFTISGGNGTAQGSYVEFVGAGAVTAVGNHAAILGSGTSPDLTLYAGAATGIRGFAGGTERVRVTSDGYVNIGVTLSNSAALAVTPETRADFYVGRYAAVGETVGALLQMQFGKGPGNYWAPGNNVSGIAVSLQTLINAGTNTSGSGGGAGIGIEASMKAGTNGTVYNYIHAKADGTWTNPGILGGATGLEIQGWAIAGDVFGVGVYAINTGPTRQVVSGEFDTRAAFATDAKKGLQIVDIAGSIFDGAVPDASAGIHLLKDSTAVGFQSGINFGTSTGGTAVFPVSAGNSVIIMRGGNVSAALDISTGMTFSSGNWVLTPNNVGWAGYNVAGLALIQLAKIDTGNDLALYNSAFKINSSGVVTLGTWAGGAIAGQYGGTGVANTGKTITLGGNFTTSGAFAATFTLTGTTGVTFPTTGTLATLAGAEALTNKTYNGVTISSSTGTFSLAAAKTLTVNNTLALAGTDSTVITFQGSDTYVGRTTTDTLTNKTLTAPTINGGTHTAITSLGIRSSGSGAFDLTLANSENLTAGRTLTLTLNDAARTINLGGNLTLAAAFVTSGANSLTLTTSGSTNVTLPTTGTLVNSAVTTLSSLVSIGTVTTGVWNAGAVTSSGAVTGTTFIPTSSSAPTNGMFLPASNTVGIATNSAETFRFRTTGFLANITSNQTQGTIAQTNQSQIFGSLKIGGSGTSVNDDGFIQIGGAWGTLSGNTGSGWTILGSNLATDFSTGSDRIYTPNSHAAVGYQGIIFKLAGNIEFYNALGATTAGAAVTPTVRLTIASDGSVVVGAPTGGSKGAGTINATAVYDDNVLLTDYVFDKYLNIESRYSPRVKERFDALDESMFDVETFSKFWRDNRRLYGMPDLDDCIDGINKTDSLGGMIQKLTQVVELQAIHIDTLHRRTQHH